MIILVAKFSLMVGLPIAAAFVWKTRTHAAWSSLFFGFGTFAISYLVAMSLDQILPQFLTRMAANPILKGVWIYFFLEGFVYWLFREGVRWLMFRYVATNVRLWRDGVLFGVGHNCASVLFRLGKNVSRLSTDMDLSRYSLVETVTALNDRFAWFETLYRTWKFGVASTIFHVSMSLAVLFGVRRRDFRPLLMTVVLYAVHFTAPWVVIHRPFDLEAIGIWQPWGIIVIAELATLAAILPFLWLIFHLRKSMNSVDIKSHKC